MKLILVVPCYNEEAVLAETTRQLSLILDELKEKQRIDEGCILYVNDGSKDRTWELIEQFAQQNDYVEGLKLAHNVGHQHALWAGLEWAADRGDAIVTIDADLQDDVDAMLTDIQQKLDTLHGLNASLPDPALSAAMDRMEKAGRSIMETVEASPAKAKQVRRFANYYLPDAVNVLEQYAKLARQGVRGENAASIRAEVERNAASIATAFENQLDALYAAESMDLSADLTVLQNMLKGQGLG